MKTIWFKRLGWFYLPVSLPGLVITVAALAFCAQVFLAVDRKSHSVSDTLYGVFHFFHRRISVVRLDRRQNQPPAGLNQIRHQGHEDKSNPFRPVVDGGGFCRGHGVGGIGGGLLPALDDGPH